MHAHDDRDQFAPPRPPARIRAIALAVLAPGSEATPEEIRDWANGQLAKTHRLVAVEIRDSLPRSTIGKIMKRELREPYWAGRGSKI